MENRRRLYGVSGSDGAARLPHRGGGGGITGLTAALQLVQAGQRVVVLEALRVGEGCTGGSTGNLYTPVASGLASIRDKWNDDTVRDVVKSRAQAIDFIEDAAGRYAISCQFQRCPLFRCAPAGDSKSASALEEEAEALGAAGLTVHTATAGDMPLPIDRGIKLEHQAQFNALAYVQGLAAAAVDSGAVIHERSPVRDIDYGRGVVRTDSAQVTAEHIVLATHTPKGIDLLQTAMLPSREYAVSAKFDRGTWQDGIYWMLDPFHSLRSYHYGGQDYLMVIGEKHGTGEGELGIGYYERLRAYLGSNFEVSSVTHQWSAQQFASADGLPYIGQKIGADNVFVATGFGGDGLLWGTLAGQIITDRILGRENQWSEVFDARRFTPAKSLKEWTKEAAKTSSHLAKDYLSPNRVDALPQVQQGAGEVVSLDGEKLAVCRDEAGRLSVLSAVCPHLGCVVHWNGADTTWDCPCHGTRFDTDGSVIEGPAYAPLAQRTPPQ